VLLATNIDYFCTQRNLQLLEACGILLLLMNFLKSCFVKMKFFSAEENLKFRKLTLLLKRTKYLHACMKSSILLLAIYSNNKPSTEYAQRLVEKYKIAIKNRKIYFRFHYKGNVLVEPLKIDHRIQGYAENALTITATQSQLVLNGK